MTPLFTGWLQRHVERARECRAAAAHSPPALLYPPAAHCCLLHQAPQSVRTCKRPRELLLSMIRRLQEKAKFTQPKILLFTPWTNLPYSQATGYMYAKSIARIIIFKIEAWMLRVRNHVQSAIFGSWPADGRFPNPWELHLLNHIIVTKCQAEEDRLSSINNDFSDHSDHDVINLKAL